MKVLLINGSPHEKGCTYTALKEITKEFEKNDIDFEIVQIGKGPIRACNACLTCLKMGKDQCVFDDDIANEVINKIKQSNALIVGTPVYYSGISGQTKSLLDRVFFAGNGFENKLGASVVSCRRGGASSTYDQLNHYFTISNMHIVGSQYWNQVHGSNATEVVKDEEGLQTMRTLGTNMSWLLKCIEQGDKNNIPRPVYEKKIRTSFIR
ncbi:MAG TPA: flavodoxin family protein [Clostridia bacterium]|nr:flavodoxin family protein [Clostridia bacterium]